MPENPEQTSPRPTSREELAARLEREADCEAPPSNEWWNGQIEALLREAAQLLRESPSRPTRDELAAELRAQVESSQEARADLAATLDEYAGQTNRSPDFRRNLREAAEALRASTEPAPAEEARAIEAHICLDCGTIYDHPTVCGLNGADSPTVPVRDAIQSREPAPAVREEARVEALKAALEWVADNYPAAITAMPTSLFRPLRESPVESSQEARRVCTCNAIDTPHGPAPDEKTPGCPVHSPAPAEEARAEYDWQRKCPTCGARPTTNCKEPSIYDEARAYREALKAGAATLMEWAPDFLHETASTRVREDDEARVSEDDLDVLTKFQRIMRSWNRQHEVEAVDRILAALEPAPPTLKGEDDD